MRCIEVWPLKWLEKLAYVLTRHYNYQYTKLEFNWFSSFPRLSNIHILTYIQTALYFTISNTNYSLQFDLCYNMYL